MQVIAILILGSIGALLVGTVLYLIVQDIFADIWDTIARVCVFIAVPTGILTFLCLCLYAVGAGSPQLTQGFVPCVAIFIGSVVLAVLAGKKS